MTRIHNSTITVATIALLLAPSLCAQPPTLPVPPVNLPSIDTSAAPQAPSGVPASDKVEKSSAPFAGWDDGFYLRSADKKFNLRITGQIQTDFRGYLNAADTTDVTTFLVRRARLGIEATVADDELSCGSPIVRATGQRLLSPWIEIQACR